MKKKKVKEVGITALYERLSRDDDGDGDSNSIVHQKQMLETYAKEHGFINLHHYTDDGWSGASFDRPAWNELVSGVKDGKITTVIVKDLSRVGRDHLQVGFFTDILFREKEVRFIAVGNSIDSNDQQSNEFAPFLNIMNEWYVRDTSKKIKAVLKSRGMSGKAHTSNSPCYGYVKDPENPDHWVVDEEAAAIVRRIFQMSIDGKGPYEIARCLAESKVERPSYYLAKKGIGNHQSDCDYNNPYMWRGNTVASILDRLEYTGCTVNFRTYKKSYKEKKSQKADKADWVIFEGTQEPIIDKETWNIVQGLRKNVRRADSLGEANPLTGKVICGECGSVMYNHRRKNGRIRVYYTPKGERRESFSKPEDCYSCSQNALGRQKYQKVCSCHAIRTSALRKIALECIRRTCAYVNNNQEEFLNLYNQISESQSRTRLEELKSRISKAERRAKEVSALIRKIYEDNIAGRLSDKMLESLLESYEKEKASLEKEEDECHKQLEQAESQSQNTEHFIKLAHKYTDFSELTPSMINEFISKIVVHRPIELSGTRTVEVEVYLNYIGKFSVPEEPVILSEEELAEKKIADEKREKSRAANRKYMSGYRKRIKEMKEAELLEPKNISAEMKGEWL